MLEMLEEFLEDEGNSVKRLALWESLGMLWNCTDIVPGHIRDDVADHLERLGDEDAASRIRDGCTYATLARVLRPYLKEEDKRAEHRQAITIRLPQGLFERIRTLAYLENRSVNYLIVGAIEEFLTQWESDNDMDLLDASARLKEFRASARKGVKGVKERGL
jgi:predicted DNA-binding protein